MRGKNRGIKYCLKQKKNRRKNFGGTGAYSLL
jgi:hypothetical protein